LCKMMQSSVCLLFFGCVLLGNVCLGSETSEVTARACGVTIIPCRLSTQNIYWSVCSKDSGPQVIAANCVLLGSAVGRYRLDKSKSSCNLIIDNVLQSHAGTYNCQEMSSSDPGHYVNLRVTNENMALKKNATQSSSFVYSNVVYDASKAVDGNANPNWQGGSCATSGGAVLPEWWAVDLGQETLVGRVRITGRSDCCPLHMSDFTIGLTNVSPWTTAPKLDQSSVCKRYEGTFPIGTPTDVFCDANMKPGRFLFILKSSNTGLVVCELEAYCY